MKARWWLVGVLVLVFILGIALYVAPTPADRFEVWKIVLDKGALAFLIAIAGKGLGIVLEKAKAAEAWATEVARERIAVSRRLMELVQAVVTEHSRWRIAQQHRDDAADLKALEDRNTAALKLRIVVHEAAMFFDEPLAVSFEKVTELSKNFSQREAFYENAAETESAALGALMLDAARALRDRIAPALPKWVAR